MWCRHILVQSPRGHSPIMMSVVWVVASAPTDSVAYTFCRSQQYQLGIAHHRSGQILESAQCRSSA